jgi:hypothetical protein
VRFKSEKSLFFSELACAAGGPDEERIFKYEHWNNICALFVALQASITRLVATSMQGALVTGMHSQQAAALLRQGKLDKLLLHDGFLLPAYGFIKHVCFMCFLQVPRP